MISELERAYLLHDLAGTTFIKGDAGTVVTVYPEGKGYEVEFFALEMVPAWAWKQYCRTSFNLPTV